MDSVFQFSVKTNDVDVKFSCVGHARRMEALVRNLGASEGAEKHQAYFRASGEDVRFFFNGVEHCSEGRNEIRDNAVFFENADYALMVKAASGKRPLKRVRLSVADHLKNDGTLQCDDGQLYGSFNFHNQVGETDFTFEYETAEGEWRTLKIETEVLSYKLDYRSDLRTILADVEAEYAMLSFSFLKDTYLSFRKGAKTNTELIWWQIFRKCYDQILTAAKMIIDRPRRRLRAEVKYERAERLRVLPKNLECEYERWQNDAGYLYRTEEMVLSHDTQENRFLKYALTEMRKKFLMISAHLQTALNLSDGRQMGSRLHEMEFELGRLVHHPFFRGVGLFKGFSQESLVMKQAAGYRDIFKHWLELLQGYDLEEGMRKLEVKEISELYEIWCFIKVKNIVEKVLKELKIEARAKSEGREITKDFIPQLVRGGSVSFLKGDGVELASVSYNAEVSRESGGAMSGVDETQTFTTTQRPDIVLRLSKENDEIKYTYLFDAKYRINDTKMDGGDDVPPEDAIDQIHRYRDAIYYKGAMEGEIKKEVIAGYVLFPGTVSKEVLEKGEYYYQKSNKSIGIGAFPLKPGRMDKNGELNVSPESGEQALYEQIKKWLEEENAREALLERAIPQKGLEYTAGNDPMKGPFFISMVDGDVNESKEKLVNGEADRFVSGYRLLEVGINIDAIQYLAIMENHKVHGYYKVDGKRIADMTERLKKVNSKNQDKNPYRLELILGKYYAITPFTYGIDSKASIGFTMKHAEFRLYMKKGELG